MVHAKNALWGANRWPPFWFFSILACRLSLLHGNPQLTGTFWCTSSDKKCTLSQKFPLFFLTSGLLIVSKEFFFNFLQYYVVLSILFKFKRKNLNICPYFDTTDFFLPKSKSASFFLTKYFFNFLDIFLAKSFKVKKLDINTRDRLKFWKTWFELCLSAKNELPMPKKSQKLGIFGHKNKRHNTGNAIFGTSELISLAFFCWFFLPSGHAYASRTPFWQLYCGFSRPLNKI